MNFLHILHLLPFFGFCRADIDCFLDDEECKIRSDNLIQTFMGAPTVEEWAVYTFYDSEDPVQPNACILLTGSGLLAVVVACKSSTS